MEDIRKGERQSVGPKGREGESRGYEEKHEGQEKRRNKRARKKITI